MQQRIFPETCDFFGKLFRVKGRLDMATKMTNTKTCKHTRTKTKALIIEDKNKNPSTVLKIVDKRFRLPFWWSFHYDIDNGNDNFFVKTDEVSDRVIRNPLWHLLTIVDKLWYLNQGDMTLAEREQYWTAFAMQYFTCRLLSESPTWSVQFWRGKIWW